MRFELGIIKKHKTIPLKIMVSTKKKNTNLFDISADLAALYSLPLPSARSGPLYNAFSYPTKISPETIAVFIACHTDPGGVVLDTFAGSGTTGLAAMLCDRPTKLMQQLAANLKLNPKWGPRDAVLYELGTLGAFIAETMTHPPDPKEFEKAAGQLVEQAEQETGNIYSASDLNNKPGRIGYVIWSDILVCGSCGEQTLFWDAAVRFDPLQVLSDFSCPTCGYTAPMPDINRATEAYYDPLLNAQALRKKRVPVRLYGKTANRSWSRSLNDNDVDLIKKIEQLPLPGSIPISALHWGDLYRSGYHEGITHIHHFYTPRNLLAVASLWDQIQTFPERLQSSLKLLVLSYNATHSTIMTRVVVKKQQRDFVLTGAQTGVLYVSSLPVEKNVFDGIKRKSRTLKRAFAQVHGSTSAVSVFNKSSTQLHLDDKTVDYVFTDPPFGDFIPYSEVNQINEAWLGQRTRSEQEVIISRAQGKNASDYQNLMGSVFQEIERVLKIQGRATVVFHSSQPVVWQALIESYTNAGLRVSLSSILDKLQASFKQVVSTVSVKGDPLLLLERQNSVWKSTNTREQNTEIINELISLVAHDPIGSKERSAERLYSRYVTRCLELGLPVSLPAEAFYEKVRSVKGLY